jgi:predicted esterase
VIPLRSKRWLTIAAVLVVLLFAGSLIFFTASRYPASADALARIAEDETVLSLQDRIEFRPESAGPTGLIIYPGGNVDYRAYIPLAADISSRGHHVVLVRMPLNLAVLSPRRADAVIRSHPDVNRWAIAGHSLGGVMAARYALSETDKVAGVIFWASYPDKDMKDSGIRALSVMGTRDGVLNRGRYESSKELLPADTLYIEIEGGNHAQFGSYGIQRGDMEATISPQSQQAQIVEATVLFLQSLQP